MKTLVITSIITFFTIQLTVAQHKFYRKLEKYALSITQEFDQISEEGKQKLKEIGDWIATKKTNREKVVITVICTSNSRRSHITQMWTKAASIYYGIDSLESFSGGTEATAFNPRAIAALNRAGFQIVKLNSGTESNPKYSGSMGRDLGGYIMYSKKYNNMQNPQSGFGAIMVCSEADKSCPVVPGAEARFSLPYDDPKFYDNTPSEMAKYDERVRQIGREIFFMMDYARRQLVSRVESVKK